MIRRLSSTAVLTLCLAVTAREPASDPGRAGLQKLNEFVGQWNGNGGPDKPKPDPRDPVWKEVINWSWKFQGDKAWLAFDVQNGKHLKSGEVRYLADKKVYQLKATDADGKSREFTGKLDDKGYLTFERTDPASGELQQLVMNTAADGIRFVYRYAVKPKGRTIYMKVYQVAANKEGESLASSGKKAECPVTGGLGTIAVTYMGKTYYVCCTGCRDAFNENPAKYVKEMESKK